MPIGTVKWFSTRLGFGFIEGEDRQDIFVHWSQIEGQGFRCLYDQQLVEYDLEMGPKGLFASHIRRLRPDGTPVPTVSDSQVPGAPSTGVPSPLPRAEIVPQADPPAAGDPPTPDTASVDVPSKSLPDGRGSDSL